MYPLHWNSKQATNPDGSMTMEVHVKQIHYFDERGNWRDIDPNIVDKGSHFGCDHLPFKLVIPKQSDGTAEFISDNRYDVLSKEIINEEPVIQYITALGVESVPGVITEVDVGHGPVDAVVYEGAYPSINADLIYLVHWGRVPRLQKIVRFNAAPEQKKISLEFDIQYSKKLKHFIRKDLSEIDTSALETAKQRRKEAEEKGESRNIGIQARKQSKELWKEPQKGRKVNVKQGIAHESSSARGVSFKPFFIWDSATGEDFKKVLIDVDLTETQEGYTLEKKIDTSFFSNAVFPVYTDATSTFYPDPNTEVTSVDGNVSNVVNGGNWNTLHSASDGNGSNDSDTSIHARSQNNGGQANINRGFLLFDTSSLGAGATVTAATLSLYGIGHAETGGSEGIGVIGTSPASNTALTTADFDQVGTTHCCDSNVQLSGVSTSGYNNWAFNSEGLTRVQVSGISKYGLRLENDINGSSPAPGTKGATFYSADQTGTSNDPKLEVTYTPGSTFVPYAIIC